MKEIWCLHSRQSQLWKLGKNIPTFGNFTSEISWLQKKSFQIVVSMGIFFHKKVSRGTILGKFFPYFRNHVHVFFWGFFLGANSLIPNYHFFRGANSSWAVWFEKPPKLEPSNATPIRAWEVSKLKFSDHPRKNLREDNGWKNNS